MGIKKLSILIYIGLAMQFGCSKPMKSLFEGGFVKHSTSPKVPESFHKQIADTLIFANAADKTVKFRYLGCGGYYMANDKAGILIDPFFSNTGLVPMVVFGLRTKQKNVEYGLKGLETEIKDKVQSIFVTHSHHDHLMDVPYVSSIITKPEFTIIYCSGSGKNMIKHAVNESSRIVNLDEATITSWYKEGDFIPIKNSENTIIVTPIQTAHAPQSKGRRFSPGESVEHSRYKKANKRTCFFSWKQGTTYSFLIDFINKDSIEFRVFIQSSAAPPKYGWIHDSILSLHPVNIAIIGAASFDYTNEYPSALIEHLNPEKVIICHWEDFFVRYKRKHKRLVRKTDIKEFIYALNSIFSYKMKVEQERFIMPDPGVDLLIKY